jgi:hypothetical protein
MMAIFLKFWQELFVLDFFVFLAAPDLAKGGVDREAVKPGRKLGLALKRFCFAVYRPEDILDDLFSVSSFAARVSAPSP